MITDIFTDWIQWLDYKMSLEHCKTALALDNHSSHKCISLQNIKIIKLPLITPFKIQSLDQGVTVAFKLNYIKSSMFRYDLFY